MNSAVAMIAAHGLDEIRWEPTDDDDLESLVGEEDLVCCHFDMGSIKETDDEDLSQSDDIMCGPTVEIIEKKLYSKVCL